MRFEIDSETKQTLKFYCEFSQNTKHDPVVIGALRMLFKNDPEFAPWLEQRKRQQSGSAGSKPPNPKPEAQK